MELLVASVKNLAKDDESVCTVEFTDLSRSQGFMKGLLSEEYFMVGITSPGRDKQVCIYSVNDSKSEIVIPINFDKYGSPKMDAINFEGIENLSEEWILVFRDNRLGVEAEIKACDQVSIPQTTKYTRREYLRLIGQKNIEGKSGSAFEVKLIRRV